MEYEEQQRILVKAEDVRSYAFKLARSARDELLTMEDRLSPILASEHVERRLAVDPDMFNPRADYLLKVRGMSMRDAGILDGDYLAVKKTSEARNGDIVVARIDDEVTVKRFQRIKNSSEASLNFRLKILNSKT